MEAQLGHHLFGGGGAELDLNMNVSGNTRSFDRDLNNSNWDGERFVARPAANASNSSSSCSEDAAAGFAVRPDDARDAEKRKRVIVLEEDGPLSLRIGANAAVTVGNAEERDGKKSKVQGSSSRGGGVPSCQVDGCRADLRSSKDYHRRHKVCEMHAKASSAVVGDAMQRFCQQCSRFHLLQEFDEGKRSCRRRLAGHNTRRRKNQPEASVGGPSLADDKVGSYILMSLLRILSNTHNDNSERSKDQELLSHLLRSLANLAGSLDTRELSGLLEASQSLQRHGSSAGTSPEAASALVQNSNPAPQLAGPSSSTLCSNGAQGKQTSSVPVLTERVHLTTDTRIPPEAVTCKPNFKDFDLNDAYNDMDECGDGYTNPCMPTDSPNCPLWIQQDLTQSPPQTSGNSDSTSAHSLLSSYGDAQCRTDRIVFKLFDKGSNNLPPALRTQILDWLSNSPTDIESYIRPGCIILTLYLRLADSAWVELCDDLSSYLYKLLNSSSDNFWGSGWVFALVQQQIAFICNGQIVLDRPLPLGCPDYCKILCVRPLAVPYSATVNFRVRGLNLVSPSSRVLCSFEGNYLFQEYTQPLANNEGTLCLSFSCCLPDSRGRGFIEVEDHGFGNGYFPFIVAEPEVCSEICELENAIESVCDNYSQGRADDDNTRNQALEFLNELGWLLRRSRIMYRGEKIELSPHSFQLSRLKWLIAYAMDHDWCAVMKKLLDFLFNGLVDLSGKTPQETVLSENLLHSAVGRNSERMVEFLLKYQPDKSTRGSSSETFVFRPDAIGPTNLTPLHIAAASSGANGVLDMLTDDPAMVGISAWKTARDSTGLTPEDYARKRDNTAYLNLVQKKIDRQLEKGHVVVGIPSNLCPAFADGVKPGSFEICQNTLFSAPLPYCNTCSRQAVAYQSSAARTFLYRPAMLTMVGIAAVCVCVGLFLRTMKSGFRWEVLGRGAI